MLCLKFELLFGYGNSSLVFSAWLSDFCDHAFFNCVRFTQGGIQDMEQYKDMYYQLFNKITDVIEALKEIQCEMEKVYTEAEDKKD